jgi:hypothetical protein
MVSRLRVLHSAGEDRFQISPMVRFLIDEDRVRELTAVYRRIAGGEDPAGSEYGGGEAAGGDAGGDGDREAGHSDGGGDDQADHGLGDGDSDEDTSETTSDQGERA